MSLRDDVIFRVIHQLIEALAKAAGLRRKNEHAAAAQAIADGLSSMGLSLEVLARIDADSLVTLLGDPPKRALVAAALLELARVRAAEGDVAASTMLRATSSRLLEGIVVPDLLREALAHTPEDARMGW